MTIPVPFASFQTVVHDSVLDYNGHMNDAAYAQVLTDANEHFLDWLGLSAAYRQATGGAMYTVEMTIRFLLEVSKDEQLRASSRLAFHDAKRLRVSTSIVNAAGNEVAAGETLYLHVDTVTGRVTPFPDDRAGRLSEVAAAHASHGD